MSYLDKIKIGGNTYDVKDSDAARESDLTSEISGREAADTALQTAVNGKQDALTQTQLSAVNSGIDSTKVGQIAANASDIDTIEGKIPSAATVQNQLTDKSYVDTADNGLQSQIDAISASSDVKDIVGTKAELNSYDTSTLGNNDIIKVLQDESENDATTYYRWSTLTNSFTLIGEEGPYYTKSQANALLDDKVDKVTGKGLSTNDFTDALKDKLDGIEAGAEANTIDSISVNGTAVTPDANKNVDLTIEKGIKTLTTADYPSGVRYIDLEDLSAGVYKVGENIQIRNGTRYDNLLTNDMFIVAQNVASSKRGYFFMYGGGVSYINKNQYPSDGLILLGRQIVDNLTSTATNAPLSANQGRILNERIGDLSTLTTTAKTSAVAAINEIAASAGGAFETITLVTQNTSITNYAFPSADAEKFIDALGQKPILLTIEAGSGINYIVYISSYRYGSTLPSSTFSLEADFIRVCESSYNGSVTNDASSGKMAFSVDPTNKTVTIASNSVLMFLGAPVNNLTDSRSNVALAANQGRVLKGLIDDLATEVGDIETALSAINNGGNN